MPRCSRKISAWLTCLVIVATVAESRAQAIDTAFAISVGGIQQWISMKGSDRRHPVLLFLHGGPGNSVISYSDRFTDQLRNHFVVVNWDQRESGKTATLNAASPSRSLTQALMTDDAIGVVNYLRSRFSVPKIYLMGHSWGGFLGLQVAARQPKSLYAYIAICPMIYQAESERMAITSMREKAVREGNQTALTELNLVEIPFKDGEQLYYSRKWLLHYAGAKLPDKEKVVSWSKTWLTLFNEASAVNFMEVLPRLECPVYFIVGGRDYQTSTELTTQYYERVQAPDKQIFLFKSAAHNVPTAEPARLQKTILEDIVPRLSQQ